MVNVIFILEDGTASDIDAPEGTSVMWNAVQNNIAGIVGECGGAMSCGTCHVYVDVDWQDKLPPRTPAETEFLEMLSSFRPQSRLACQIELKQSVDGLKVRVAPQE